MKEQNRQNKKIPCWALILLIALWIIIRGSVNAYAAGIPISVPEIEPLTMPVLGNRTVIWLIGQVHILFASFILGVPLFIIISEFMFVKTGNENYERLAHDITRVVAVCYSLTALSGGTFALLLFGLYPVFASFIIGKFSGIWLLFYPFLFTLETLLMYTYYYSWDALSGDRKKWHLLIGILLNVVGIAILFVMDAPASYMLTPPTGIENPTFWDNVNNFTWMPLNFHRLVGNMTFGGYMVCIIAASMYIWSDSQKEREYYDWQGYIGNLIGVGAMIPLPIMGYIYALEIYLYDASLGIYMMSDRLSMFFETQGILVGLLFVASNFYFWLSMQRITGADRFASIMKVNFVIIFFGACIWFIPRHYFATMIAEPGMKTEQLELAAHLGFLALMKSKNTAAIIICLLTLVNFFLYKRAVKTGDVAWGKINPLSQYVLLFLGFSDIWLMNLMGSVRELARKNWHVYMQVKDITPEAYTPTLFYASILTTQITLVFFLVFTFVIWLCLKLPEKHAVAVPQPVKEKAK
ncbi:MAG: cytochrome ubiquinol oxidase subunit I [Candidatus Anammoxibacter sp.]